MPGNEVGDRVHNFFGQENLSQGQYNSQAVDGNWAGLSNNLWARSQRTVGAPFISNLKNFNTQQSDAEQGNTSSPRLRHGLNLPQSNLRPESGRNQPQNQETAVNGYTHGHQVFQTRQNEANIMGVDTESGWHSISRGMSLLESQGSGLELYRKNLTRTDAAESPVNFDFFGGQQQISGRHPGMLQSMPRQLSGINDMQLLQQQVMLTQMQELQRQQQFHQVEARQQSSISPASSISKQTVGNHSASLINGIPINEASNVMWQPQVMATNTNWLQRGGSPIMQESFNGLLLSPEQRQGLRQIGIVPNQGDQSLYGLPISSSRGTPNLYSHSQVDKPAISQISIPRQFSHVQGDKPALPHISASGNSFPGHQYAAFSDQTNAKDGTSVSRQDIEGKNVFGSTIQGINSGLNMQKLQQVNSEQRNVVMQDFHGRQELAGSSEKSQDKMVVQVPPPPQNVATLDPTEEKILFGSDESLWDAFGQNTGVPNMLDGTDSFNGFPSLQSGSWSALMQSAVAETSSGDMGVQEEWSSLSFCNTECLPGNERSSTIDSRKQQSVWAEKNLQSASNVNSRPGHWPDDVNSPYVASVPAFNQSGLDTSHEQHDGLLTDSSLRSFPQLLEKGKQKPLAEGSHMHENATNSSGLEINDKGISSSWTHQQMLSCNSSGEPFNRSNGSNHSRLPASIKTYENEKSLQPHHEKATHKEMGQVLGTLKHDSDTNSSVGLEHVKSAGNLQVCGENSGMNGITVLPNSGTTWVNRQSNQQLPNSLNVNVWRDADSSGSYRGNEVQGKYQLHMEKNSLVLESSMNDKIEGETHDMEHDKNDKSTEGLGSNSAHHRSGGARENVCFNDSDLCSPKSSTNQVNQRPPVSRKFLYHPMGDFGVDVEPSYGNKHVFSSQLMSQHPFGGMKDQDQSYLGQSKFHHTEGDYTEMDKGDSKCLVDNTSKSILPGHMQKTLSLVDGSVGNYAPNKIASTRVTETEASDGSVVHHQRNQSSSYQGIGLQLAPPTQRLPTVSHGSSEKVLTTLNAASEIKVKGHSWLASPQTLPSQESSHGELRSNISGTSGQIFDKASPYSVLGNIPQPFSSGFPFSRIHAQNQNKGSKEANTHDMENINKTDNSAEGLGSNSSHHRAGNQREDVCFDGSDLRTPKLSNQVSQRPPVSGKFQYHPMGDLGVDVEPYYGNKYLINSQDRGVGSYMPNKAALPRVLDTESSDGSVVHPQWKQSSSTQGFGLQLAPPTQRLPVVSSHASSEALLTMSRVASETGDKGRAQLATTQTLPSEDSSHGELKNNISGTSGQIVDKPSPYSMLGNIPQTFTSGFPFSRIHTQNQNMLTLGGQVANIPCANVSHVDRTALMNQIDEYCERPQTSQSELACAQMSLLSGTDQICPRDPAMQNLASEACTAPQPCFTFDASQHGAPSKVLHNVWTSVSSKQHPNPSKIPARSQPINDCEMTTGPQKPGDRDSVKDENDLSDVGPCSVYSNSSGGKEQLLNESSGQQILPETADAAEEAVSASHEKESVLRCSPDASHSSPAATSRDIEAFGRSLRANNFLHQSFSLLHQVQSMKSMEFDPSNRDVKRFKVSDNVADKQQLAVFCGQNLSYGHDAIVKDVSGNHSSVSPSDPNMVSLSMKPGNGLNTNASSPEALGYGQKNTLQVSDSNKAISVRSEHSLTSPQMAPSWFEQYGTFKNGKILPMYDSQNMTPAKIMDQSFIIQDQSESVSNSVEQVNSISDTNLLGNACQRPMPASVASDHVPIQLLPPAVEPDLVMRPKKRKSATSELVPWNKELTQGSERLKNISAAELDWAQAANRLIEKIEEDDEIIEDLPPMVKSRRRLVLTTQLMQQLLNPPPAAVLSADVKLHHESVVYSVARLALGDACSSVSWSGRDAFIPPGSESLQSENLKSSDKIDQLILKVMEDLVGRARKLENDILRLDSRASILDLRVECQDLERFSVINRFAKFYGRGQNDGTDTSSSAYAAANAQKMCLQKYVTAISMPRNLPDRVQCLSL